jgi:hypothetical protein
LRTLLKGITTDTAGLELFINDLAEITQNFSSVINSELVRFRLQVIKNDMCKYFHYDYNSLRLLTTYRGNGTEWVANENVNRHEIGCQNNEKIIIDSGQVNQLETFWVGIFKGELFMNNSGNGIVHRSPSLLGKETRILLRLDA